MACCARVASRLAMVICDAEGAAVVVVVVVAIVVVVVGASVVVVADCEV